jgi:hypothetical protein
MVQPDDQFQDSLLRDIMKKQDETHAMLKMLVTAPEKKKPSEAKAEMKAQFKMKILRSGSRRKL